MSDHHHQEETLPLLATYAPPAADIDRLGRLGLIAGAVGAVATAALGVTNPQQFFQSYLVAFIWVFGISLGCFALMCIHHLSGGAWGLMIRRVLEAGTRTIPILGAAFIPVILGMSKLYVWMQPGAHEAAAHAEAGAHVEKFRDMYLTRNGFIIRAGVCFVLYMIFSLVLSRMSLKQDETGDPTLRKRMGSVSAGALVLHFLMMTSCGIDWIMSLTPQWNSTIFGPYLMVGQVVSALAFIILVSVFLSGRAPLKGRFRANHFHDYGKLLLAFIMIWAYFGVSQFLIIWSGNLPEETSFYMGRMNGGWKYFSLGLIFAHFVLPFVLLLSRNLKRDGKRLVKVAAFMLVVRWFDLYWLVAPAFAKNATIHPLDITTAVALLGLWFFLFTRELKTRSLLPSRETQLKEALGHG